MDDVEHSGYVGRPVIPREGYALVQGRGCFVSDIRLPGVLSVSLVRSQLARGRVISIDTRSAEALSGVVRVVTAAEMGDTATLSLMQERVPEKILQHPGAFVEVHPCNIPVLASTHANHVGQGLVAVVANSRHVAEDACELVDLVLESEDALDSPEDAVVAGAPAIDPTNPGNVAARIEIARGEPEELLSRMSHRLKLRVRSGRLAASPMETRAVLAAPGPGRGELTVWTSSQVPYLVRAAIARQLGTTEAQVRVIVPDVGGGFGCKVHVYPEEILVPYLARLLQRPVRWVEDRQEHFVASAHSRDQTHDVEVGFDDDGVIQALSDEFVQDCGVGFPYPMSSAYNIVSHIQGLMRIPALRVKGTCVLTNKAPNVPYRGSGRPEASFVRDRVLQEVATHRGLTFIEVLRRNMISGSEMPYHTGLPYRDGEEIVYDGCDLGAAIDALLPKVPVAQKPDTFGGEATPSTVEGVGFGTYTEGTGVGPFESGGARLDEKGMITVYAGSASQGQSHETTLAQIAADEFGLPPEKVRVCTGDTSLLPYGVGTYASRTTTLAGSAVLQASRKLRSRILEVASELLEASPQDLELADGLVRVRGTPVKSLSLADISRAARPGSRARQEANAIVGMEESDYFVPETVTWGYGLVAARVSVDLLTGVVTVKQLLIAHDCGRIINPLVVEGQVDGGLMQGLGAALLEEIVYDADGTPRTTSFMDYLLPTMSDAPEITQIHLVVPSLRNPLGVKGVGEAGIIGTASAIVNAIASALGERLVHSAELNELPIRPENVLRASGSLSFGSDEPSPFAREEANR